MSVRGWVRGRVRVWVRVRVRGWVRVGAGAWVGVRDELTKLMRSLFAWRWCDSLVGAWHIRIYICIYLHMQIRPIISSVKPYPKSHSDTTSHVMHPERRLKLCHARLQLLDLLQRVLGINGDDTYDRCLDLNPKIH